MSSPPMRADAKKNYEHVLAVARVVMSTQGSDASMRDIARQADVGLATLLRHFPTREALFEALVRTDLDTLTRRAAELQASASSGEAISTWLREWLALTRTYKGVVALMAAAHANPESALHVSCAAVHAASARLLVRAQDEGTARADMTGDDLFGLMSALGWLVDLPSFAPRADHLAHIVASAILPERASGKVGKAKKAG